MLYTYKNFLLFLVKEIEILKLLSKTGVKFLFNYY